MENIRDIWEEIVNKYKNNNYKKELGTFFASDVLKNPYLLWLEYYNKINTSFNSQRTMCLGIAVHEFIERNTNLEKEIDLEIKFKKYTIKGRLDLLDPKNKIIYEIKTCKSLDYVPYINNLCQLSIYMRSVNSNYGVLLYIDKNTGEHKNIVVNKALSKNYYLKAKKYFDYMYNILKIDDEKEVIKRVKKSKFFKETEYQLKFYNIKI